MYTTMFADPKTVFVYFLCKEQLQLNARLRELKLEHACTTLQSKTLEEELKIVKERLKEIEYRIAHLV